MHFCAKCSQNLLEPKHFFKSVVLTPRFTRNRQALVSRDLFLFPVSKYNNICGLSTAWHRVKCYMHCVRVISKLSEGKGYDLVELQCDSYDVWVFFDRLQMAFFELHDKHHPISGLEHVIKVLVEIRLSDLCKILVWREMSCSDRYLMPHSSTMPVDILQNRHASVVDADFDEVGGVYLAKIIISSLMVQYIGRNLDNHCLAEREKRQLERQIR